MKRIHNIENMSFEDVKEQYGNRLCILATKQLQEKQLYYGVAVHWWSYLNEKFYKANLFHTSLAGSYLKTRLWFLKLSWRLEQAVYLRLVLQKFWKLIRDRLDTMSKHWRRLMQCMDQPYLSSSELILTAWNQHSKASNIARNTYEFVHSQTILRQRI